MSSCTSWNLLVFRDASHFVRSVELVTSLRQRLKRAHATSATFATFESIVSALLSAGELESALADAGSPVEASRKTTDLLASRLIVPESASSALPSFPDPALPPELRISPQEGFAYYALHPADFAELINQVPLSNSAAVIGIRSIGTTLSASVLAALKAKGIPSDRITVRPTGHPYDRHTEFTASELEWISTHRNRGSRFLITDEGPGISGSSFLSVGEALIQSGISRESISFLCTRRPDPAQLKAPDASRRWPQFHAVYLENSRRLPDGADTALAGGRWRSVFLPRQHEWPAVWTSMERSKFLSADRQWFLKFEGFGHYGEAARERGQILSDGRFSRRPEGTQHGYTCYPVVKGTPLAASDLTRAVLDRMAQYCAFRKTTMSTPAPATNLAPMLRHNLEQELGVDFESIHLPFDMADLYASAPIVADARMMPHDWIACGDGRLLKVDATCHGDDHFFPGPTDIAWDLAGAIVEWRMEDSAAQYLLEQYRRSSADHQIASRLPAYLLAYSVFRMAYCRMAAAAIQGAALQDNEEHSRLQRAYRAYRQLVDRQVAALGESRSGHRPLAAGGA